MKKGQKNIQPLLLLLGPEILKGKELPVPEAQPLPVNVRVSSLRAEVPSEVTMARSS